MAGDTAISAFYSPDRLGLSNPLFLSFSGTWDREENRMLVLDAGMNYQSKFDVSTYWLGGYGIRYQDRLGLAVSAGGVATPRGGSFVIGPNVRIDLVGPLSLRYIGLQTIAAESSSQVEGFTHLIGVQIKTLSF
jgi:hypothetical protein